MDQQQPLAIISSEDEESYVQSLDSKNITLPPVKRGTERAELLLLAISTHKFDGIPTSNRILSNSNILRASPRAQCRTLDGEEHMLQESVILNKATFPQAIPEVLKSIQNSGFNLNSQQEGTTVFLPIPKVTKEHRENLSKNAKLLFIKCRDAIKDVQNKTIKSLKRKDGVSEDLVRNIENHLKALGDKYISEA
ncbi:ribosome-recycling factor, mitochondrial-like [Harmonia axyridis]|uniref:ribosome-recycling factor, mitochondrial-like n=1 Tax=Harmonia axyridis TaxID=115357 RepID=UPI001E27529D|nr:ribosome-recycling factor, mitochondrial-like [Harmonia axyridis]